MAKDLVSQIRGFVSKNNEKALIDLMKGDSLANLAALNFPDEVGGGYSLLSYLALTGKYASLSHILDRNTKVNGPKPFDVNVLDNGGFTPLHRAVFAAATLKNVGVVACLIEYGADIFKKSIQDPILTPMQVVGYQKGIHCQARAKESKKEQYEDVEEVLRKHCQELFNAGDERAIAYLNEVEPGVATRSKRIRTVKESVFERPKRPDPTKVEDSQTEKGGSQELDSPRSPSLN